MLFKILTLSAAIGTVIWISRGKPGLNFFYALVRSNGLPFNVASNMWSQNVLIDNKEHSLRKMRLLKSWEYELGSGVLRSKRLFEWQNKFYLYTVEHYAKNPVSSHVDNITCQQAREMSEEIYSV